jgi:stress response protein SCP2
MDFNRVHASGTSKILHKGESYLSAATLKAVDLEEHWSWADGDTKYLDATCLVYDRSHCFIGLLDYQSKTMTKVGQQSVKEGVLSHSGDQLDAEKQSGVHKIHVQVDALPDDIQYLYITVSAWAGAKLSEIRQPSVRLCEANGEELCRYDVDGADKSKTAILMCVLHRRPERSTSKVSRWALEAIGEVGFGAADNYGPIYDMVNNFRQKKGWN